MRRTVIPSLCSAVLLSAACGTGSPAPPGSGPTATATAATPTTVPAARGPVTGTGTVMHAAGGRPELCLGPVMESFPPQCAGLPLDGWDWERRGVDEAIAEVAPGQVTRWGEYHVTGTFDGTRFTVTEVVPVRDTDPEPAPSPRPSAPPDLSEAQWAAVEAGVGRLPGLLTVVREPGGPVQAEVVHDDGSLQDWADATFGIGVVRVGSALR